jgi:hypothetical protein
MISGRIAYRRRNGEEIGRENFELRHHAGGRLLRAFCEMDDVGLSRDVTLAMDQDWRPLDGFCRIIRDGATESAIWFFVSDHHVICEGVCGPDRLSLSAPTSGRLAYLGLHPLAGDGLIAQLRGTARPGDFQRIDSVTNSISPNGDENPGLHRLGIDVCYDGRENIQVTAGDFAADHFRLRWHADWPPAELWVRASDGVFLMMRWSMIDTWYELTEVSEKDAVLF